MITFSANLGFLWKDRRLPDAIHAAKDAGFDAVECHFPYEFAARDVSAALSETGLTMVSLNTWTGDGPNDFGLAAMPGRENEARGLIDQAVEYAAAINCPNVSVFAGRTSGTAEAEAVFRENLAYAAHAAQQGGQTILIEPLNTDVHDYHLVSADVAVETIKAVDEANVKVMVDCFHSSKMDGALVPVFERVLPHVGHIQISAFPDRGEPIDGDPAHGGIVYSELLPWLVEQGYGGLFGAEYNPTAGLEAGLGWLNDWRTHP